MKRLYLYGALILACSAGFGQISHEGIPWSSVKRTKSAVPIPTIQLPSVNTDSLLQEDAKHPLPYRYAVYTTLNRDIYTSGVCIELPDSGNIWRMRIASPGAYSLGIVFGKFHLQEGAKLYVYNDDQSRVLGAFTSENNKASGRLALAEFPGDHVVIELNEPDSTRGNNSVVIESVSDAYKDIYKKLTKPVQRSSLKNEHETGATCPVADPWRLERHAVCRITFQVGASAYYCTGALLNNTRKDGIPYFLTANHCFDSDQSAETMVAYFNYEYTRCNGSLKDPKTISGAMLKATNTYTDFTLVELSSVPPPDYQAYYAGWSRNSSPSSTATTIHHPNGGAKEVAFDFDPPVSNGEGFYIGDYYSAPHTVWITNWEIGRTEAGSSGSPLFDKKKRLIGQLHGGTPTTDTFGKFSVSWGYGDDDNHKLSPWLDPDNTDSSSLQGYIPDVLPEAALSTTFNKACTEADITLEDHSLFDISSWQWDITPLHYSFVNGTSSSSQNPQVRFDSTGTYTVSLMVSNANGENSITKIDYITISNDLEITVFAPLGNPVCAYKFENYPLIAHGAKNFQWEQDEHPNAKYISIDTLGGDSIRMNLSEENFNSTVNVPLKIIGSHGTCIDSTVYEISIVRQPNDSIKNAINLQEGKSSTVYSNLCATIEEHEPYPEVGDCETQYSWCDEYGTGLNVIENSIWFTFTAPSEKPFVNIETTGFDNQIALYEANTYHDIISGDEGSYEILAANDDYPGKNDYSAKLDQIPIIPGQTYWLQVDGSAGGEEGEFSLTLDFINDIVNTSLTTHEPEILVYPNPSLSGVFYYRLTNKEIDRIDIYDLKGNLIQQKTIQKADLELEKEGSIHLSEYAPQSYLVIFWGKDSQYFQRITTSHGQ